MSMFTANHTAALEKLGIDTALAQTFMEKLGISAGQDDTTRRVSEVFHAIASDAFAKPEYLTGMDEKNLFGADGIAADVSTWADANLSFYTADGATKDQALDVAGGALQFQIPEVGLTNASDIVVATLKGIYEGNANAKNIVEAIGDRLSDQTKQIAELMGERTKNDGADLTIKGVLEDIGVAIPTDSTGWGPLLNLTDVLADAAGDGMFGIDTPVYKKEGDSWKLNLKLAEAGADGDIDSFLADVFVQLREASKTADDDELVARTCADRDDNVCIENDYVDLMLEDAKAVKFSGVFNDDKITLAEFKAAVTSGDAAEADTGLTNAEWNYILDSANFSGDSNPFEEYYDTSLGQNGSYDQSVAMQDFVEDLFLSAMAWKLTPKPEQDDVKEALKESDNLAGCC